MCRVVFIMEGGRVDVSISLPEPAHAWALLSRPQQDQVREAMDDAVAAQLDLVVAGFG